MADLLKELCCLFGASGDEAAVRDYILNEIKPYAESVEVDALGNIIALKKGKNRSKVRLMVDAHMDEVGIIVTAITPEGFLKFDTLGGIKDSILLCCKVKINGITGVIGAKPIHLTDKDESKKAPKKDNMYIDIGVSSREEAEQYIGLGDSGVLLGEYFTLGDNLVKSKALDDRIGCKILIDLIKKDSEYDFYATFTVGEEIGCRGARTVTYYVNPDAALTLEATTANDIDGASADKQICKLGNGPAVSFMDNGTVYYRNFYTAALESGVLCQPKAAVAGGNNSSAIHLARCGVKTLAISVPCRYIHTPCCVADLEDIENAERLTEYMINKICSGEVQ